jgi:hypothetical protein
MKAIKLAPQIMHKSKLLEDVLRVALSFEEEIERITTEVAKE